MATCLAKTFQIITVVYSGRTVAFLSVPNQPVKCTRRNTHAQIKWQQHSRHIHGYTAHTQSTVRVRQRTTTAKTKHKFRESILSLFPFSRSVCRLSTRIFLGDERAATAELSARAFLPNRKQKIDFVTNGFFDFLCTALFSRCCSSLLHILIFIVCHFLCSAKC